MWVCVARNVQQVVIVRFLDENLRTKKDDLKIYKGYIVKLFIYWTAV